MDVGAPGATRFQLVFGGHFVAVLDGAAAVEAGILLLVLEGGAVGVGGHAGAGEGGDGFAGGGGGGEGAEEGQCWEFWGWHCGGWDGWMR